MQHRTASDLAAADFPTDFAGFRWGGTKIMMAWGDTVPPDGAIGYGKACFWLHTDGANSSDLVYVNNGDETSSSFLALAGV
jgi:hypothetical protein